MADKWQCPHCDKNTKDQLISTVSVDELDKAIAYFENDENKKEQDGPNDYINFQDRLDTLLKIAKQCSKIMRK